MVPTFPCHFSIRKFGARYQLAKPWNKSPHVANVLHTPKVFKCSKIRWTSTGQCSTTPDLTSKGLVFMKWNSKLVAISYNGIKTIYTTTIPTGSTAIYRLFPGLWTFPCTRASSYIHICWFNFDALAQGNAYKPTKEPINYRGPGGDRTHDLQTEATPPAASCPARTLHATEIAPKTQLQWHARGCTGQLTTRLECTGVNFNTCVC